MYLCMDIVVRFQLHAPTDAQWHVPMSCNLSAVLPKGLSLFRWIFTGFVQWIFNYIFLRIFSGSFQ